MTKNLNLKNMVETYKSARCDMDMVWTTFYNMTLIGFITQDMWVDFSEKCKSWVYDSETETVVDAAGNTIKTLS